MNSKKSLSWKDFGGNFMALDLHFQDDQYAFHGITHQREIARAIFLNDKNEICLTKLLGDDKFGHRDYYETPGGGMKPGETPEQALYRELIEETGFQSVVLSKTGDVLDYYNLIGRENHNHYYFARATHFVGKHLEEAEVIMLEKLVWVPIEEALRLYQHTVDTPLSKLVKQREIPVLLEAQRLLKQGL